VRVLDPAGEQVHVIGRPGAGSATGVDYDQPITRWAASVRRPAAPFNRPTKVALASNGDLFISDGYGNARMHRFDSTGELLGSWGEPGSGPGQFMLPHSVSLLADGRLVVADRENDRLQFFGPDGDFRAQWTCVQRPTAAVQDRAGRIWVSELGWGPGEISGRRARIALGEPPGLRLLDPAGNVVGRWTRLPGGDSFVAPHGLATDSAGNLYIAEVSFSLTGRPPARALHRCAVPAPGPA
jgi:sugar lactone lactonase YvrE